MFILTSENSLSILNASPLSQRSPAFLAPGMSFMENKFSTDGAGAGDDPGGNASDGEQL